MSDEEVIHIPGRLKPGKMVKGVIEDIRIEGDPRDTARALELIVRLFEHYEKRAITPPPTGEKK